MQMTIESTTKVVEIVGSDGKIVAQARVWEGRTASGIEVQALITRVAAPAGADQNEFVRELQETRAPSPDVEMWPLRMIL
jgi:hypothetical protein